MSVAEAMEAGFLPALDEDQANMLPQRSCALGPQVTNPGYPGLSQFIWWYRWPANSTILVLSRLEIAPYDRMNVTFLVYADNAVSNLYSYG